jgi:hypothetical protein
MPMAKAFLYSALLHVAVVVAAFAVPIFFDIFDINPLPVEDKILIDVEIAGLTETIERRAPNPTPKPQPKPAAEPEPEPQETKVAALPPQPEPVPEPSLPEPVPGETAEPEMPPLPVMPRAKPTPPPKEDEFESMLKDLAQELEIDTPEKTEDKPESDFLEDLAKSLDTPDPAVEPDQPIAQLAAILGNRLTISEADALSRHIEPCWNVQIGARNPEELAVDIRLYMNRDGTVRRAEVVDKSRMSSDRFYRAAAEAAMRAVLNKRCQPLPIPPKKYEQLKSFVYRFDPSVMVGR